MRRFAVIGLGRFGFQLACSLGRQGVEVLAIDHQRTLVDQIKAHVTRAVCTDASLEENLRALSLDELDIVAITIGAEGLESSILATAIVARLKVPHIIARATNDLHAQILKLVGAHEVVNPESDLAERLAQRIAMPAIHDLIRISNDGYSLSEIVTPRQLVGKTLAQSHIRKNYGLNIVGIKRRTRKFLQDGTEHHQEIVNHSPGPNDLLQDKDILICIGTIEQIESFAALDRS